MLSTKRVLHAYCAVSVLTFALPSYAQQSGVVLGESKDQIQAARDSGADAAFVIEQNGERIDLTKLPECSGPPERRNGVVKIDCSVLDGPVHYFDESTHELIQTCSIWGRDEACPPERWPVETADCENQATNGISGTWRLHSIASAHGYSQQPDGWAISISADSMIFEFREGFRLVRSYAIASRDERRYRLELRDGRGMTETIGIDLLECGFLVDSGEECGRFCENFRNDVLSDGRREEFLALIGDQFGAAEADRLLEALLQQPIFIDRSYYQHVVSD